MRGTSQSYLLTNGIPRAWEGHNNLAAIAKQELGVEVDKTLQNQTGWRPS